MEDLCPICAKHRGKGDLVGPVLFADELIVVTHRPLDQGAPVPGYLFVETRRHAPTLADLTDEEAGAVGWAARRAAAALRAELAPDFVFSFIAGRSVPHFHQHLFVRPSGTPDAVPWHDIDSSGDAPRIDTDGLRGLCKRLSGWFADRVVPIETPVQAT